MSDSALRKAAEQLAAEWTACAEGYKYDASARAAFDVCSYALRAALAATPAQPEQLSRPTAEQIKVVVYKHARRLVGRVRSSLAEWTVFDDLIVDLLALYQKGEK